jgi:hypothetical protein
MALMSYFPGECADGPPFSEEEPLTATLEGMRRCPARGEYIELHFTTNEGAWSWCFPAPARQLRRRPTPIALTPGPYGVIARRVTADGELGSALDARVALPAILAGADVVVARRLVTAGR